MERAWICFCDWFGRSDDFIIKVDKYLFLRGLYGPFPTHQYILVLNYDPALVYYNYLHKALLALELLLQPRCNFTVKFIKQ